MLSAYRIGGDRTTPKIWLVRTDTVADPKIPKTLPIGSAVLTLFEARKLAEQILEALDRDEVSG